MKKNTSIDKLQHQIINLETVSLLSFRQLLTDSEYIVHGSKNGLM